MIQTAPRWLCPLALLALLSCSSDDDGQGPRIQCVDGDGACGASCTGDSECDSGLHCEAGACQKACVPDEHPCAGLDICTAAGRCMSINPVEPDASTPGPGPGPGPGPIPPGPGPSNCADTVVPASRTMPTVILIVDQSGSMEDRFMGAGSRWDVLRGFLLEPGGLIDSLQGVVRFGLAMYSAVHQEDDDSLPMGECPLIETVAPDLNNLAAVSDVYSAAEPIEDTPTGDAIDAIVDDLGLDMIDPDAVPDPTVFILATDGEPDRCEELNPQNGQEEAIDAVGRAHDLGIRTFVISVGRDISATHQQDIANAGLGRGPGDPDAEYWVAGDAETLAEALTDIVGGQLSCEITLDGHIEGDACLGTVRLGVDDLTCNDPNGWELVDDQHIRLLGTACERLKAGDTRVEARFPCEVGVVR